jgi:hypothetical protein
MYRGNRGTGSSRSREVDTDAKYDWAVGPALAQFRGHDRHLNW